MSIRFLYAIGKRRHRAEEPFHFVIKDGADGLFGDLRHTHAALPIAAGQDPHVISKRLGHASIRTTYDVYGHLFAGRDSRAAYRLEQLAHQAAGQRDPANRMQLGPER